MVTRYIALDSTYRNRNLYPKPGEFEVFFTNAGTRDRFNAYDPISNSAPELVFTTQFDMTTNSTTLTGTVTAQPAPVSPLGNTTSMIRVIVTFTAGHLNQNENYYIGAVAYSAASVPLLNRITAYKYEKTSGGLDYGVFVFESPYSTLADGTTIAFTNPTDFTDLNNPYFFIPTGNETPNYYHNRIVYNQTQNEFTTAAFYNPATKLLRGTTLPSAWALTDTFVIRKTAPAAVGPIVSGTVSTLTISTGVLSLELPLIGSFIRMTSGSQANVIVKITGYTETAPNVVLTVSPMFSSAPSAGNTFEFLQFTRDNVYPLVYSGSTVSQQDMVCYDIKLVDLILPNRILNSGRGGIIAFYPYVFVELQNVSSPNSGNNNSIYSNNPNSKIALFKVAITEIYNPEITPFVRITGTDETQTVKFKPNDNLKFAVKLPSGEILNTIYADTVSPSEPDPFLQVSALFGITRNTSDCCPNSSGVSNMQKHSRLVWQP
jgi:hypothetical protein